jgi:signal transduction histidine kinase
MGALEMLNEPDTDHGDELRQLLIRDAAAGAFELERLVEDYLTAARLSAGALTIRSTLVDLDVIVERILTTMSVPETVSVKVGGLGRVLGDAVRVKQIVRNVLLNASRYARSEIEISGRNEADRLTVEILNDGPPVATDLVGRLFDPFVKQAIPGQPGTIGLGLSVSRDLSRRMGGDLTYSYRNERVCFSFSLPVLVTASTPASISDLGRAEGDKADLTH